MSVSRRSFLQTGSRFGLAALLANPIARVALGQEVLSKRLGTGIGNPVPRQVLADRLYNISRAMFIDNLKTKFTFRLGRVALTDMTLIEVEDLNPPFVHSDGTGSRDCFSLVFRGPSDLRLRQDTYTLDHRTLGVFNLFVVPGYTSGRWTRYGAIINRVYP